jgi:hypothetical protein
MGLISIDSNHLTQVSFYKIYKPYRVSQTQYKKTYAVPPFDVTEVDNR